MYSTVSKPLSAYSTKNILLWVVTSNNSKVQLLTMVVKCFKSKSESDLLANLDHKT